MKNDNWILKAFLMTFFIALIFSAISNVIATNCDNLIVLSMITIIFILIGIFFDLIGTAVLTAEESTFHAMCSQKIKGAKESIKMIKNAPRIASICNDVIGDICGIISGTMGAMMSIYISNLLNINTLLVTLLLSAVISSLTVGGKALGKEYGLKHADKIITVLGKMIYTVELNKNK